jgi:para-aminobenzoate synthetase/4-amino-4-deoxychorismate lyase
VNRNDVRLYHKTTSRETYDDALASAPGIFDVLLWNEDGEATELTRGNLVAELDGCKWTPPVECGLLGGTLRAELLEAGEIAERAITVEELARAERLWFVNALRGWVPIAVV